jgi:hypothetical protein
MKQWTGAFVGLMLGLMTVTVFAQSWTSPRTWVQGELVTPSIMNSAIRDNLTVLRAGGLAVASQAAGDLLCASSATQWGRCGTGTITLLGGLEVPSGSRVSLGGDTYINESGPDNLALVAGNVLSLSATPTAVTNARRYNSATLQPGFLAYNSADDAGVGSSTLEFDTEAYDEAGNFDNSTDTFTATVTGRYQFCGHMRALLASGTAAVRLLLVTTALTYALDGGLMTNPNDQDFGGCVTVPMTATDTAHVSVTVGSSTLTVYSDTGTVQTYFSGRLVP